MLNFKNKDFRKMEFVYKVNTIVVPDSYDDNVLRECTHGIHFFLTEQEAWDFFYCMHILP